MYSHKYIARIVLEAETPLFVGSGESTLLTDAIVQKDIHGFPMIPGTSLAGVLRHALEDGDDNGKWNSFFGYQAPKDKKGLGSQIKVSSAYLILENGKVAEGLEPDFDTSKYGVSFNELPVRQHVRIDHKGTSVDKGLYDNEVVYKGCRFVFEVELKGSEADNKMWEDFLKELSSPLFRIGQGTRNGYGQLSIIKKECKAKTFDLTKKEDFESYFNYDISLNAVNTGLQTFSPKKEIDLTHYKLELKPESFFIFGAGFGDEDVDAVPVKELVVHYDDKNTLQKPEEQTLIPGTSIKGALAHRTAFYYNKDVLKLATEKFPKNEFEKISKIYTGRNNQAVFELFGAELGADSPDETDNHQVSFKLDGHRGKVIINDILQSNIKNDKIFNHVAIDRFTGGAMDGALFSEKVSYFENKDETIDINVWVESGVKQEFVSAFEAALKDVCRGLLPLGGMTTKGHGIFTGKLLKNEEKIYDYESK
ncbi:MAG: hypothetical protein B6D61_06455 [Bacteroidetes bacterium 4484_249]|nr:MAG: hypothetical protein B6D61_06455 [Bacteroidetes bacterium 4484_249]